MKPVNKTSINGMSFFLENDAYDILQNYLDTIGKHYEDNANRSEIIEGIEERIAELLLDRVGKDGVVTAGNASEVIGIIGKPEEIFGDAESREPVKDTVRKRLYRDPDNKKIAGVLAGLAAYFNIDAVWVRLVYAVLTVLTIIFTSECDGIWPATFFIIYIILWICTKPANTYQQKCEMKGSAISCPGIEKEAEKRAERESARKSDFFRIVGKITVIFLGAILAFCGLIGIIAIFGTLFGFAIAGFACQDIFDSLLSATGLMAPWMMTACRVFFYALVFIPCLALLYAGIRLIFNFKSPKWKPGLIMLLLWIASIIGLGCFGWRAARHFTSSETVMSREAIADSTDTLYVRLMDIDKWQSKNVVFNADADEYSLVFLDKGKSRPVQLALYPTIELDRTLEEAPSIEISAEYFTDMKDLAASSQKPDFYRFEGDTLFVWPVIYGGEAGIRMDDAKIEINVPHVTTVIVDGPYPHKFDTPKKIINLKGFNLR